MFYQNYRLDMLLFIIISCSYDTLSKDPVQSVTAFKRYLPLYHQFLSQLHMITIVQTLRLYTTQMVGIQAIINRGALCHSILLRRYEIVENVGHWFLHTNTRQTNYTEVISLMVTLEESVASSIPTLSNPS